MGPARLEAHTFASYRLRGVTQGIEALYRVEGMKILFCIGHDGFIRNFEAPLRSMADRGHEVVLAVSGRRPALMSETSSLEDLCERYEAITYTRAPKGRDDDFAPLASAMYGARDYFRFLTPEYRDANELRARGRKFAPDWAQRFADSPLGQSPAATGTASRALQRLSEAMPLSDEINEFLRDQDPDVVLITPLINFQSSQNALLRSAMAAGIPTALLVHSWDNLTNKGLIHHSPDRVLVWNEAQKKEAVELQAIDPDKVVVTGAQSYDHWFNWESRESRESFCAKVGLDPSRPYLLYVCSSAFIAPDEQRFVRAWIEGLRSSGLPELEQVGVLVRPHPQLVDQWEEPPEDENAAIWPHPGTDLAGEESRSDYFESFHHAKGVVGINTSAFVEAAIMDRPSFTVLTPENRDSQEGTLHFGHLADGGPLIAARTFEDHHRQLQRTLQGEDLDRGASQRFVDSFVRPLGPDRPSAEYVVDAVEQLAGVPLTRERKTPRWHRVARRLLEPRATQMRRAREKERELSKRAKKERVPA